MSVEVKLPELGDGIESGDVLALLISEGDTVEKDQGLLELETDKATVEIPCPHAGTVTKIHVRESQTVPIGATLVTLEAATVAVSTPQAAPPQATPAVPPAPNESPEPAESSRNPDSSVTLAAPETSSPELVAPSAVARAPQPDSPTATAAVASPSGDLIAAGPAVRRFAREVGVDLRRITGTGKGDRITRDDVLAAVRLNSQASHAAEAGEPKETTTDAWGPVRFERLSKIRRTIAAKMHESWSTVPRVTNFDDADVSELERLRQANKADYAKGGIKLTSMPFVIKAVAMALGDHPTLNASLDLENERVVYKEYVNVGIAVDTDRGLVVPSLRAVDKMSIPDTARELAALAEKVRDGSFGLDELRGSTFTISNLGAIGGTYSTPIINVPEVAILLVGRSRKIPVVVDDRVEIRLMMPLSLSYDHRLVDGATAARFLNDVIGYLEAPGRLLLAL